MPASARSSPAPAASRSAAPAKAAAPAAAAPARSPAPASKPTPGAPKGAAAGAPPSKLPKEKPAVTLSVNVPPTTKLPGFSGGGDPLVPAIRTKLEASLGVDAGAVRVHTDPHSREVAVTLSARAVTYGNHILLGPGEQPTDLALMSHEVAHVVQQEGAPRLQLWSRDGNDRYEREAHR